MKTPIIVIALFLLFSCQDAPVNFEGGDEKSESEVAYLMAPPRIGKSMMVSETSAEEQIVSERKLIRTGFLNMSVKSLGDTKTEIERICRENNAFISSEEQSNYTERLAYNLVIRIPAAQFDILVQKIEGLAHEVKGKNIQTSDVTEEFIDKEARIKTKKELESRYRDILKQAKEVSDILSIESQLNIVRADIESMEGRLKYLQNQVSYSTLTLSFFEPIGAEFGFGSKTIAAFTNGWDMLLVFLIGLVNIWPFIVLLAGISYVAYRRVRKANVKEAP